MLHEIIKKIVPEYTCKLPSTNKKIVFRPLLVKEEKYISQITELSDTFSEKLNGLVQLVNSCCDGKIKSENISVYDFQILLMEIRKKSISETAELKIRCPYTGEPVVMQIDFNDQEKIIKEIKKNEELILNDNIKLKFRIPQISDLIETNSNFENDDDILKILPLCLLELESESKTIDLTAETNENKLELLQSLNREDFAKIKSILSKGFFSFKFKYQTSDGVDREVVVSDFVNFLKFYLVTLT